MVILNTKPNHSRNFISDVEDIRRTEKYKKKLILIGACQKPSSSATYHCYISGNLLLWLALDTLAHNYTLI